MYIYYNMSQPSNVDVRGVHHLGGPEVPEYRHHYIPSAIISQRGYYRCNLVNSASLREL